MVDERLGLLGPERARPRRRVEQLGGRGPSSFAGGVERGRRGDRLGRARIGIGRARLGRRRGGGEQPGEQPGAQRGQQKTLKAEVVSSSGVPRSPNDQPSTQKPGVQVAY